MKLVDLIETKAELLCYGVQVDDKARRTRTFENSYLLDGGFVHAAHFMIEDTVINTCVVEDFCKKSPYKITWDNDKSILTKNDKFVCKIDVLPTPAWCDEKIGTMRIGDYIRPHSPECISCCPNLECSYKGIDQCQFCSLNSYADNNKLASVLDVSTVAKMIKRAIDSTPGGYEIALSGGTCNTEDKSAVYFTNICHELTKNKITRRGISIELVPPDKDSYIEDLHRAGATAIIMNIEIANEEKRREICLGKSSISLTRYFDALKKAVDVFGRGNVSSVLIAGIQPEDDIKAICSKLIPMGVVPTIIPFKPLNDCSMSFMKGYKRADPKELVQIAKHVNQLLVEQNLYACRQEGCTKCGGCSLEIVTQIHSPMKGDKV